MENLGVMQKKLADSLSRHFASEHRWKLHSLVMWSIFQQCCVDLVVKSLCLMRTRNAWPAAPNSPRPEFQRRYIFLSQTVMYISTHPVLLQVLRKIRQHKVTVTLVAPKWLKQFWFTGVLQMTVHHLLSNVIRPLNPGQNHVLPPQPSSSPAGRLVFGWTTDLEQLCSAAL